MTAGEREAEITARTARNGRVMAERLLLASRNESDLEVVGMIHRLCAIAEREANRGN